MTSLPYYTKDVVVDSLINTSEKLKYLHALSLVQPYISVDQDRPAFMY